MCYENEKGRRMGYSTLGIMCAFLFWVGGLGGLGGGSARIIDPNTLWRVSTVKFGKKS